MGKWMILPAITVAVLLIMILFSGCASETSEINNTTSTPVQTEPTLRPNLASQDTLPASGHVYMSGKPAAGVSVVAVSYNGSDRLLAITDSDGAYTLNILPYTMYNVTAYSNGLKHTIFPVYLRSLSYSHGKDVADQYDIVLTAGHNSTIAGKTSPGWIRVNATPIDSSPSFTAVSNYSGQYSLDVEPGIEYRLSGKDYYDQIRYYLFEIHYRNYNKTETVTVNEDETLLIDLNFIWLT